MRIQVVPREVAVTDAAVPDAPSRVVAIEIQPSVSRSWCSLADELAELATYNPEGVASRLARAST